MKSASSLKSLAVTMKAAPVRVAPEPPRVVSYRVAETRGETRQLSGHFPAVDVQALRVPAAEQDRDVQEQIDRPDCFLRLPPTTLPPVAA
jgi:hypothetical protein